ncbi:MAG: MoxR family ATPase [Actinomycetota bacterium]|nr:MoxR family ATPase [Actinomycetota bacterium]
MQTSTAPLAVRADDLAAASDLAAELTAALGRVVRGKPQAVRLALVALLSGGHLLVEDVPGVGKTLLGKTLARAVGGSFRRIQATPDLLPGELTGVSVFSKHSEDWDFRAGPLFANVVLVDEINRATPRTQSALLEAMEEQQVTVDGVTHPLPDPFFVVATQNPFEHVGTFPLVEGQRDRFSVVVEMGLPARDTERELLLGRGGTGSLEDLPAVTAPDGLRAAMAAVRRVHCDPAVADYIVDISSAIRSHPEVRVGASPRASLSLLNAARAQAVLARRSFVSPDDVKAVATASMAHRLILGGGADLHAGSALVRSVVERVPVPRG